MASSAAPSAWRSVHLKSSVLTQVATLLRTRERFNLKGAKPHINLALLNASAKSNPPAPGTVSQPPVVSPSDMTNYASCGVSDRNFMRYALGGLGHLLPPVNPPGSSINMASTSPTPTRGCPTPEFYEPLPAAPDAPAPRSAAVMVPLCLDGGVPSVLFIQRSRRMRNHRGQAAFPGGMFDPEDMGDAATCALRETAEEIGVGARACAWPAALSPRSDTTTFNTNNTGTDEANGAPSVWLGGLVRQSIAAAVTAAVDPLAANADAAAAAASGVTDADMPDMLLLGLHHDCSTSENHRPGGTVMTPVIGFLPRDVRHSTFHISPVEVESIFCVPLEALCDPARWGVYKGRPSFDHFLHTPYKVRAPEPGAQADATASAVTAGAAALRASGLPAPAPAPGATAAAEGGDQSSAAAVDLWHEPFYYTRPGGGSADPAGVPTTGTATGAAASGGVIENHDADTTDKVVIWGATAWILHVFVLQVLHRVKW